MKFRLKVFFIFLVVVNFINHVHAQVWKLNHRIGTISGVYNFAYNQTPSQLVEIFGPSTGFTYQWEQCTTPEGSFSSISGATSVSYSFVSPLSQSTYYRRKAIHTGTSTVVYSNTIKITVGSVNWEDINYVRENDINVTGVTTWQAADQLPIGQKLQTTTYMDGLGRSLQTVSRETATPATPTGLWGDHVQFSKYNADGTQTEQYLGYITTTQSGKYKTGALTEQAQYYSTYYNETSAKSLITVEASPLNRITNLKDPGGAWAASTGKSVSYELNTTTDDVKIFSVDYTQGNPPVLDGVYVANSLFKTVYTDENDKKIVEYSDKSGRLILKKVQLDDVPANVYSGWICTYYVYDNFGRIRYELQPEAVKYLYSNSWSFAGTNGTAVLNNLCFQYNYDDKGRMTWKKNPGADGLNMIYDVRDRLVFTQDGNQANLATPQWTATLYDELDRPVLSTLYNTTKSIATLKTDLASASATGSITITNTANNGGSSVTVSASYSALSSTDLNSSSTTSVLKYLFYDNYSFPGVKTFNTGYTNLSAYSTSDPNVQAIAASLRTLSTVTGSKVRVLGSNSFLNATTYYDDRGSAIQSLRDNTKSGVDIFTGQYHFDGRVLSTCSDHTTSGTGYTNYKILTKYLFDKLGRPTSIQKQFGSNPLKTVVSYDYDDMGRVKTKHLDPGYTGTGGTELESLNYTFNIHGNLTGINKDYALKSPSTYDKWGHFFGMYLGYANQDNVFAQGRLNGQITGVIWNTQGDDAQRKYDYSYDNAGRLTKADFKQQQHLGNGWANTEIDFTVTGYTGKITYDLNGNLISMLQKGVLPGSNTPVVVDDLRYSYASYSNKLVSVTDQTANTSSNGTFGDLIDGSNGTNPDYVYDNNGNVVIDLNKNAKDLGNVTGANGIHYNFLDKPDEIRLVGKGVITITYSGDGEKLKRTFTPVTGSASTTTYINQFVYQSSGGSAETLSYISFEAGRIRVITPAADNNGYDFLTVDGNIDLPNNKKGAYDYFILDYLQNVRMVLSEQTHIAANTATMEDDRASVEEAIFGQPGTANEVAATRDDTPPGWTGNTSYKVSKLGNNSHQNIGPNTLQKVMAGDLINANVQYYYDESASGSNDNFVSTMLSRLVQAMTNGPVTSAVKGAATNISSQLGGDNGFINAVQPSTNSGSTPLSYLTILFFDERFKLVSATDGGVYQEQVASSVNSDGASLTHTGIKAPKNGYVFIYVSNQSDQNVYFDNLVVSIQQGHIIEENHYYSFGLKISGISSRKIADAYDGVTKNNYQMQGAFSEMDDDIGWNDFTLRNYDPQIGRWVQQDPYQQFASPYLGMANDPVNAIDPTGGISGIPCPGTGAFAIFLDQAMFAIGNALQSFSSLGGGLVRGITIGLQATQTAGVAANAIGSSNIVNAQITTTNVGIGIVNMNDDQEAGYWILYNGTQVIIYKGEYGNTSTPYLILKGSSGSQGLQNSQYANDKSESDSDPGGPLPEGEYSIDLQARDPRATANYPDGKLEAADAGIQLLYNSKTNMWSPAWGRFRARLQPINIDNPNNRGNFYIHDSYKGYSHGCIETETMIYYFLLSLHDAKAKNIKVKVQYPTKKSSTKGGTDKLDVTIPKNVKNPYRDPKNPQKPFKPNKNSPIIPIPKNPYTFQT